ncbi:MAG: FAD-dependent oxidoreductase [Candidatus Rokubacteria bacterium]|nr:FAD-dependent oxidoreductase [Candidatus Rokubacteria bacterium]
MNAVIIGAGPAGLAAAHELSRHGAGVTVLERLDGVGGLARTLRHDGCRFDIGPHRFYTKNAEVGQLFTDVLRDAVVPVERLTRILYRNRLFDYPLTPVNALRGVGVGAAAAMAGSYAWARTRARLAPREPVTFEDWVAAQFGWRLYRTFFKTYTEKVWGIPCAEIGAEWAVQRIKGLNLGVAIARALAPGRGPRVKTLVDRFLYPRHGTGQLYEGLRAMVEARGGVVRTGWRASRITREGSRIRSVVGRTGEGREQELEANVFLSSASITDTIAMIEPGAPEEVRRAAAALRYRDHIGVHLVLEGEAFPDQWIYVHAPELRMARVTNHRRFSRAMAGDGDVTPVTVEYFVTPGDELARESDAALVELASAELARSGLARRERLRSAFVVRSPQAYPVIDLGSTRQVDVMKRWMDTLTNLLPIGRSGMFKYNNQDHAIATGLLAARTFLGLGRFDPWRVNIDAEYLEDGPAV